jgi:hypothetical protein
MLSGSKSVSLGKSPTSNTSLSARAAYSALLPSPAQFTFRLAFTASKENLTVRPTRKASGMMPDLAQLSAVFGINLEDLCDFLGGMQVLRRLRHFAIGGSWWIGWHRVTEPVFHQPGNERADYPSSEPGGCSSHADHRETQRAGAAIAVIPGKYGHDMDVRGEACRNEKKPQSIED